MKNKPNIPWNVFPGRIGDTKKVKSETTNIEPGLTPNAKWLRLFPMENDERTQAAQRKQIHKSWPRYAKDKAKQFTLQNIEEISISPSNSRKVCKVCSRKLPRRH